MTRLGPTCTGCCIRNITYNAVISGTHTPQSVHENDDCKILWDFNIQADKVIEHRRPDIVCINKQKRVSDYWLCYSWWPKYSHQRTGKSWQVSRLKNRITESLECQSSGHTSSYRCSRNYVEEDASVYKTDWPPGRHNIHLKNSYPRNSLYPTKSAGHLRNWVDFICLV